MSCGVGLQTWLGSGIAVAVVFKKKREREKTVTLSLLQLVSQWSLAQERPHAIGMAKDNFFFFFFFLLFRAIPTAYGVPRLGV